jgi:hypothetical protein
MILIVAQLGQRGSQRSQGKRCPGQRVCWGNAMECPLSGEGARGLGVSLGSKAAIQHGRRSHRFGQRRVRSASCSGVSVLGPSASDGGWSGRLAGSCQQLAKPRLRVQ